MNETQNHNVADDLPTRPPGQSCEAAYRQSAKVALVRAFLNSSPYPPGSDAGRFQTKIREFDAK